MLDNNIKDILCKARDNARDKGITASFLLHREKSHLMRIGNNSVSLSTSEVLTRLDIEVINGKRSGNHGQLGQIESVDQVLKMLQIAVDKANVATESSFNPLANVVEKSISENDQYDEELENLDPLFKAEAYKKIFNEVGNQYNYSGSWSSGSTEIYLITTANDNDAYHIGTDQQFNVVLKHPEQKWELRMLQSGWKKTDFSANNVIAEFKEILPVYENNKGFKVQPGDYTVVFGASALAEILEMTMYTSCYGRLWEEKQGWTAQNKIGDKILGENISIIDDPHDDNTFKFGFDFTGKKRAKFPLIENGIFKNLMYDPTAAAKYDKKPTGHSVDGLGLVFKTGHEDKKLTEAVKDMGKVLYIPALHYVNLPNANKGIFTGSSRFNAVLIENGKIVSPIFSSRVTDTFQNVLSNVVSISNKAVSINTSSTYGRRAPVAVSVPSFIVSKNVKITDSSDSF